MPTHQEESDTQVNLDQIKQTAEAEAEALEAEVNTLVQQRTAINEAIALKRKELKEAKRIVRVLSPKQKKAKANETPIDTGI